MSKFTLARRLKAGETLYTAWCGGDSPYLAEGLARTDLDAVAFDMQHSLNGYNAVRDAIQLVAYAGKPAIVRIALDAFAVGAQLLDSGAQAIIAPMINSVADAERLAQTLKFPPLGERSWGPVRAMLHSGQDGPSYLKNANDETLVYAMIETQAALDALDGILAVDGIDGVFVGPSDLSIALFKGKRLDPFAEETMATAKDIARRAKAAGKLSGVYCQTPEAGRAHAANGFGLICLMSDLGFAQLGAKEALKIAKG